MVKNHPVPARISIRIEKLFSDDRFEGCVVLKGPKILGYLFVDILYDKLRHFTTEEDMDKFWKYQTNS